MSGFAAIFRFDGAPVDSAAIAAMASAIDYRGPDGIERWAGDGASLVHLMFHTTAESLEEVQPLLNDDRSLVLVMDGWLANLEELRRELLARGAILRTRSDAELVLRAYEAWGDDCAWHLDGEYAFVVWDIRRREALCVKDHAGLRPLHYHWDGRRLLVASDIAGVLAAGDFEKAPNRGMIAEHLTNEWYSADETLWQGVMRLPPARQMRVGAGGIRLSRHWAPDPEARIRHASDADYQAHYREVFEDAVRRCSRSHVPLACEVSGGHDSSAVFGVAHRLQREGRLLAPGLFGYTYFYGADCPPDADEIAYARAVGQHLGADIREVTPFTGSPDWFAGRIRGEGDISTYPNVAIATNMGSALAADGCRVALTGHGGDEFLAMPPFGYAQALAERDWRALALSLREDGRAFGVPSSLWRAFRFGIGPNLPAPARALFHRALRRDAPVSGRLMLPADMLEILDERRAAREREWTSAAASPAGRMILARVDDPFGAYMHEFLSRTAARVSYEFRNPMHARSFIEFAAAIPERQRGRAGRQKFIHIAALEADLPKIVAERQEKAGADHLFEQVLDNARDYVITPMLQRSMDWIEPSGLAQLLREYDRGPREDRRLCELWAVFGCRTLFD